MEALVEPAPGEAIVETALSLARNAIERREYSVATSIYYELLRRPISDNSRSEAEANMAVALYMLATANPGTQAALLQLRKAQGLLQSALRLKRAESAPRQWMMSRANLALVHMALHGATGDERELLAAHLALDDTQPVLDDLNEPALDVWMASVHAFLAGLREQHAKRRPTTA